jgi:hypothetical protein
MNNGDDDHSTYCIPVRFYVSTVYTYRDKKDKIKGLHIEERSLIKPSREAAGEVYQRANMWRMTVA